MFHSTRREHTEAGPVICLAACAGEAIVPLSHLPGKHPSAADSRSTSSLLQDERLIGLPSDSNGPPLIPEGMLDHR